MSLTTSTVGYLSDSWASCFPCIAAYVP